MPYAVFPRTPGRDFAGVVVDGPADLIGKEVFGSSGDLGIRRDGTHATHLVVEAAAVVEKPASLIAWRRPPGSACPSSPRWKASAAPACRKPGETVLVLGVNGKVGQAATQIATWRGARVIGVVRRTEPYRGPCHRPVSRSSTPRPTDVAARVRELTGGKGADIVYNTVGEPYYEAGTASLAKLGRQIFIAAVIKTGRVRHLRLLSRPAHLCRHRHPGAFLDRDRGRCCANWFPASPAGT